MTADNGTGAAVTPSTRSRLFTSTPILVESKLPPTMALARLQASFDRSAPAKGVAHRLRPAPQSGVVGSVRGDRARLRFKEWGGRGDATRLVITGHVRSRPGGGSVFVGRAGVNPVFRAPTVFGVAFATLIAVVIAINVFVPFGQNPHPPKYDLLFALAILLTAALVVREAGISARDSRAEDGRELMAHLARNLGGHSVDFGTRAARSSLPKRRTSG